ncbi:MAG TPA: SDR family NAD(P)-dependent oxidoreductase [Gammaproteobacteria bacterium]|nr:SDR family NAD(P)-dependent oxidoreductase [Gammaproteobacteria bacterium]
MNRLCEGRVAIVTGGARGLGRDYSLMLARHGAKIVVNDLGGDAAGNGADLSPAQAVVDEIRACGGEAVVNGGDVSDWTAAQQMVQQALDVYGRLDVLINNAGILRDRMFVNMTEADWDQVVRVHLKGTAAPCFHAVAHWRANKKAGKSNDARILNTTSHSGLFGSLVGQTNYAAAKAGIASFSLVLAQEMATAGYGVTVNVLAPRANTRLTAGMTYTEEVLKRRSPTWIASLATWLASAESREVNGRIFEAWGIRFAVLEGYTHGPEMEAQEDPALIGPEVRRIVAAARPKQSHERGEIIKL